MRRFSKILTSLLTCALLLSSVNLNVYAGKPGTPPPQGIIISGQASIIQTVATLQEYTYTSSLETVDGVRWNLSSSLEGVTMVSSNPWSVTLEVASQIVGVGSISITATDNTNRKNKATLVVPLTIEPQVQEPNNEPYFEASYRLELLEDTEANISVIVGDLDGDTLSLTITQGAHGQVTAAYDSLLDVYHVIYMPLDNYYGPDTFDLVVHDGKASVTQSVPVQVNPVEDAPVGVEDAASVRSGESITLDVLANDRDPDNLAMPAFEGLSLISVETLANASIIIVDNKISFLAEAAGDYQFTYVAEDLAGNRTALTLVKVSVIEGDPVFVALGDSIPDGYYYTNIWNYLFGGTNSYSYIEQLRDSLGILPENYHDMSVSGFNSIDVLDQLNDPQVINYIREADIITLCVGANDIMDAAARKTSGLDKYNIDWTVADSGRDSFETNWIQIIDGIETLNPDVTLVVMTIYNPYRLSDSYFAQVDPYFTKEVADEAGNEYGLNYIIENTESLYDALLDDSFDYRVADIYEAFNTHPDKDSLTGFYRSFCDPHPNQNGQNIIFTEHMNALIN